MKVIALKGLRIDLVDVDNTPDAIYNAVGGTPEPIALRDGGAMVCDMFAQIKEKPYNSVASLIAGSCVYGDAFICGICGDGFSDVPDAFIEVLNFPEDMR